MRPAAEIAREAVKLALAQYRDEASAGGFNEPHLLARLAAIHAAEICIREANELLSTVVRQRDLEPTKRDQFAPDSVTDFK